MVSETYCEVGVMSDVQVQENENNAFVAAVTKATKGKDDDNKMDFVEESDRVNDVAGIAGERLKSFIERVERLEEEKAELQEDIKEVMAEAKAVGFDTPTMRKIIKLRKMDPEKRREADELLELYKAAIGMF